MKKKLQSKKKSKPAIRILSAQLVDIRALKPHPRNYREHPEDQLAHLSASIREQGLYRNVVLARDSTILAGHGIVRAAKELGISQIPAIRLGIAADDPRALKVLAGDNEIGRGAETDDRALTEILKEINNSDLTDLLGSGFTEEQLAALVMITRPASEIQDKNEAAHWAGMPEFGEDPDVLKLVLSFRSGEDRKRCLKMLKITSAKKALSGPTLSAWWPAKTIADIEDASSLRYA
jgi:ParB-like nuclease domain